MSGRRLKRRRRSARAPRRRLRPPPPESLMSKTPIIIVKKKGHGAHGHHGGAWKVAFADFMTAMMAFFLVMWIVGQAQTTKKGLAGYFRDPGVLEHERSTGILPGATAGIANDGPPPVSAQPKEEPDD